MGDLELDNLIGGEVETEETSEDKPKLIKEILIETLSDLTYPVRLQGSLLEDEEYPDSFFTYWNNDSLSDEFYSNSEGEVIWHFDLNFYSVKPAKEIEEIFNNAISLLQDNGFIVRGRGFDVPTDEPSHTGRGVDLIYIEKL